MTEPPRGPLARSKQQTVRLACPCGRNLADVRLIIKEPQGILPGPDGSAYEEPMVWTDRVFAFPRPGVRQSEHAHGGGSFTFRWYCRCGRTWEVRRERIDAIWREHKRIGRVIRLILGHDVM